MCTKSKSLDVRINKSFNCLLLINNPNKNIKNHIKPLFKKLLHEPEPKYNLNYNYNSILGKIEVSKQEEKGVKLFDIKGHKLLIKLKPKNISNNRLHYCNEKGVSIKKVCHGLNDCIELDMMDKIKFDIEIRKSKELDSNSLYALDVFDGEGSCNNNNYDNSIMYSVWLGQYPKQVQVKWQSCTEGSPGAQRRWKDEMKLEEKIEDWVKEDPGEGLIPNCRTRYLTEKCKIPEEDKMMEIDYNKRSLILNIGDYGPILNGRTDPILNCRTHT